MTISVPAGRIEPTGVLRALIEEAWARCRRRHRWMAGGAAALLVAGLVGGLVGSAGGDPRLALLPLSGAHFATEVTAATRAAGTVGVTVRSSTTGSVPGSETWKGSLDFDDHGIALAYSGATARPAGTVPEAVREVGGALYFRAPARTAPTRPWLRPGAQSRLFLGVPEGALELSSPFSLLLLDAVHGTWVAGPVSRIGTRWVREYSATVSLTDAEAVFSDTKVLRSLPVPFGPAAGDPRASAIDVTLRAWVDGAHRIARLSASEPQFEARIGGTINLAQQFPGVGEGPPGPPAEVRPDGSVAATETFYAYGAAAHRVAAPGARSVKAAPSTILTVG
jgi:hypothetical protein